MEEVKKGNIAVSALKTYFTEFAPLRHCSRNFWVVQLVNLLDGVAYFGMLTVATLYLSETLGFNDKNAAWLWGACMAVYTAFGFIAGFVGDSLGIKRTLHLSVILLVLSRLAISFTEARLVVIPALFVIAVGTAIMTPILISATKRYTTKQTQTAGFNMLYLLMNVGAFLGNYSLDWFRGMQWGNRTIFMVGSLMSILCWLAILLLWARGIEDVDEQLRRKKAAVAAGTGDDQGPADSDAKPKWEAPWTIAASVFRESAFWRFMLFLVVLVGVRLVFEHQYQVYPKYYQRTIAEYRFAVPPGLEGDLQRGGLSAESRSAFAELGYPLTDQVQVLAAEEPGVWQLEDGDRTFLVREMSVLRVARVLPQGAVAPASTTQPGDGWMLRGVERAALIDLDGAKVPDVLRQSFAEQGVRLPDDATVKGEPKEHVWTLHVGDQAYDIACVDSNLSLHNSTPSGSGAESGAPALGEHLGDLDLGTAGSLQKGVVSGTLRQGFADSDLPIGTDARVETKEDGSRWEIESAEDVRYYVRKDEDQISIYISDAPIGRLNSINPFIIMIGVIISTPIVARFKLFNVMFVGICFSAASMLILAIYPGWFIDALGISLSQGYSIIAITQIIIFSLGEVIWSPRLYEYTAAIAPEGREASYMGLSYLPMFFARFSEGPLAGEMLTRYCPPDVGARLATVPYAESPQFMNLILAAIAVSTPILILLFRSVIQKEASHKM